MFPKMCGFHCLFKLKGDKLYKILSKDIFILLSFGRLPIRNQMVSAKVSMAVGQLIQKGRQAKGWSQKELATKICEKPQIVNEYESSKAVNPNQAILGKIERALEIKLRGKDKGAPLAPKLPKKAK